MLYVFCGNDTLEVRKKALLKLEEFCDGGIVPVKIESETYETGMLASVSGGVSLFGERVVCLLDTPSLDAIMQGEVIERLEILAASENIFVLIEGAPLVAYKRELEKYATTFTELKEVKVRPLNPFALNDALAARDKKALWLQLRTLLDNGLRVEEIVGTLWWQLKTMRIVSLTKNAEEAGMKDFTYNKANQALRKYSKEEVEKMSQELLVLYHDAHAGKGDMELSLERWVLGV